MSGATQKKPAATGLPIAAVERETGLGKDTLRVWEKRYGFPQPLRDAAGDRLYPAAQVERLKLISRLMGTGQRPGKIVGMGDAALQALLAQRAAQVPQADEAAASARTAPSSPSSAPPAPSLAKLLDTIGAHDPQALRHALSHAHQHMGLARFVTDLVAPLTTAVGDAWAQGRFEVFEEHLYTEVITGVLRHAIVTLAAPPTPSGPTVLLTTLPQELHGLGLLMVEALLALEGCTCVSLGTQTPIGDIVQAAQAHRADVVALSFTSAGSASLVLASLRELRAQLPAATALWVGGSCGALYQKPLEGVLAVQGLAALKALVAQWRSDRRTAPAARRRGRP